MKSVQAFADSAAAAVEELSRELPLDVREQVVRAMEAGCRLSLSVLTRADAAPEILLELVGTDGTRARLLGVAGQRVQLQ